MESQPTDRRAITSPANGRLGGRKRTAERYAPIIRTTEKALAEIVRDDVPQAVRELVRGVLVEERTPDGRVIYARPPDIRAIEMVLNRIMGAVAKPGDNTAVAVAQVVNIIRGGDDLGMQA